MRFYQENFRSTHIFASPLLSKILTTIVLATEWRSFSPSELSVFASNPLKFDEHQPIIPNIHTKVIIFQYLILSGTEV